jgi:hypothetical protein
MTYHFWQNLDFNEFLAVMDCDALAYKTRQNWDVTTMCADGPSSRTADTSDEMLVLI